MHPDRLPAIRVDALVGVPHDAVVEHVGDHQHHLCSGAGGQHGAGGVGVQQPRRVVEAGSGVPVGVVEQLTGVHHHPQPHALAGRHPPVVGGKAAGQAGGQRVQQPGGGDLGVGQQPQAVTGVAADRQARIDLGMGQRVVDQGVESVTEPGPDGVGPLGAAEPFDVDPEDPPIDRLVSHISDHPSIPFRPESSHSLRSSVTGAQQCLVPRRPSRGRQVDALGQPDLWRLARNRVIHRRKPRAR